MRNAQVDTAAECEVRWAVDADGDGVATLLATFNLDILLDGGGETHQITFASGIERYAGTGVTF